MTFSPVECRRGMNGVYAALQGSSPQVRSIYADAKNKPPEPRLQIPRFSFWRCQFSQRVFKEVSSARSAPAKRTYGILGPARREGRTPADQPAQTDRSILGSNSQGIGVIP